MKIAITRIFSGLHWELQRFTTNREKRRRLKWNHKRKPLKARIKLKNSHRETAFYLKIYIFAEIHEFMFRNLNILSDSKHKFVSFWTSNIKAKTYRLTFYHRAFWQILLKHNNYFSLTRIYRQLSSGVCSDIISQPSKYSTTKLFTILDSTVALVIV